MAIARLPHPYRYEAGSAIAAEMDGRPGDTRNPLAVAFDAPTFEALRNELRACPLNPLVIDRMARYRSFALWAQEVSGVAGQTMTGNLFWALDYLRWCDGGRHFLQTTDGLEAALRATDIGEDIPASYLQPPYPDCYLQLGETLSETLTIFNNTSGDHCLEGTYLRGGILPPETKPVAEGDGQPGERFLEFVLTGSPEGKAHAFDDASSAIMITIPDEAMTIGELLRRTRDFDRRIGRPENTHAMESTDKAILHVAKVLLYLNSEHVEQVARNERSELAARLARVGPGKRGKLQRQLQRTYDRIVIGPKTTPETASINTEPGDGTKRAHWRRGHFREQAYGEKWSLHRLRWIKPTLINADTVLQPPAGKPYLIKESRKTP